MATQTERDFVFIYRDENGELITFYPRTLAKQVVSGNKTMEDHVYSTSHVLSSEKQAMINAGKPSGYVVLDENGLIPMDNMNRSMRIIEVEFENIDDMLTNSSYVMHGTLVMVIDATGDPTVEEGWAIYRRDTESDEYWNLNSGWKKVLENESIDIDMTYENMPDRPDASASDADAMVRMAHSHKDNGLLELIGEDNNGNVTYNGERLAYDAEVQRVIVNDYIDDNCRNFDFWLKPTFSQSWWDNDSIRYVDTCYELFRGREDIVKAEKLLTGDVTTVARMFYQCYNLEETQQYNTIHCVDFTGQYQECRSLTKVPFMGDHGTERGITFDNMFNKCSMLEYSPEMSLKNATSVVGMYSGCTNLTRVLPFNSTKKIENMKYWFNGCISLIKITDPIDFSSITTAENVDSMFNECESLEYVKFVEGTLKVSLSLKGTNLSRDCLIDIIEGLPSVSSSGEIKILNLTDIPEASDVDDTYLASAATKGWQILID